MTKKLWQRVAAVAMATFMAACTLTTAFAVDESYNPDTKTGSITVHKFSTPSAPSNTDANIDFDGNRIDDTSAFGEALPGVTFQLYAVEIPTSNETATGGDGKFDTTQSYDVDWISAEEGVMFTDADGDVITKPVVQQGTDMITNESGEIMFDDLPAYKLYALLETNAPEGYTVNPEPSFIRVPLTNNDGKTLNYDVHVYPKNVNNKYVTKTYLGLSGDPTTTVGLKNGQSYSWNVTSYFKNNDAERVNNVLDLRSGEPGAYTYGAVKVTDLVEDYFKVTNSTVEVYFINAAGNRIGLNGSVSPDAKLTDETHYEILSIANAGDDLVVTLKDEGINAAINANAAGLVVEFDTVYVGSTDVDSSDTAKEYTNKANAFIKAAGDDTDPTPEETDKVIVPTVDLLITKIDGSKTTDNALGGVKFKLATNKEGTAFVTDAVGNALEGTTDSNGNIIFSNIPFDKDQDIDLYLVETQTLTGYQLKEAPIKVTVSKGLTGVADAEGQLTNKQIEVEIKNYPNGTVDPDQPAFQLPLTGGTGTVMLVIAGIGVLVLVGFLTVAANRKSRKEQ